VFLLTCSSFAQKVVQPWQVPCSEESVTPNLSLQQARRFFGDLNDQSGSAWVNSPISLRKLDANGKYLEYRKTATNKEGHFDFGTVDAGRYRFLPAPNRGFKQPREVPCWEGRDCEVKLVLHVNPSDQEFNGCPIQ